MPTNTYVALDTITLTGSAVAVSFINIPSQYTDLVLVLNGVYNANNYVNIKLNNDTNTQSYSGTYLAGNGSSSGSGRFVNSGYGIGFTSGSPDTAIFHIMNYSNPNIYKNLLIKTSKSSSEVRITAATWRKFDVVNMLNLLHDTSNGFAAGSTFTLYGIAKQEVATTAKATGGVVTYGSDGYVYHTFYNSGTFTPSTTLSADILVVAGGGGGGSAGNSNRGAGGGGAGGLLQFSSQTLSTTGYAVTVGAGGAGGSATSWNRGESGNNSQFASLTSAIGGGYGTPQTGGTWAGGNAGNGGSGGGAGNVSGGNGGTGTSGQGNNGGNSMDYAGGGGGGALGAGLSPANSTTGGLGGSGLSAFTGTFSAGGRGGNNAENVAGISGNANTGNGGGGAYGSSNSLGYRQPGGAGGSGIVIVRYLG